MAWRRRGGSNTHKATHIVKDQLFVEVDSVLVIFHHLGKRSIDC
jgi:hypothetical protein